MQGIQFKYGIVWDSKPGWARVHFDEEDSEETGGETGFTSDWLPVLYARTHKDGECWPLEKGEHVQCLMDCYCKEGSILGAIYDEGNKPPGSAAKGKRTVFFEDGTVISYTKGAGETPGKLEADVKGDVKITATGDIDVKGKAVKIEGDVQITGKLDVSMNISTNADVKAGPTGVSLLTHLHSAVQPGSGVSGMPVP